MTARLVTHVPLEPEHNFAKRKRLKPIYDRSYYSKPLYKELESIWYHTLYKPILSLLDRPTTIQNSKTGALNRALAEFRVQYKEGYFYGPFSAIVSRQLRGLGATFDRTRKAFKLSLSQMPLETRQAIATGVDKERIIIREVKARIDAAEQVLMGVDYDFSKLFEGTIYDANNQFLQTTKSIGIPPSLTPAAAKKLADAYSTNLKPYVKDWSKEAVQRLRAQVTVNVVQGFRSEEMIRQIQAESGVTKRKAEFLARQETSLLVSKFREERYKDIGLMEYEWSTSHDERVRKDHKELNGRTFSYQNPPVVDKANGRRANPGEDFGCRCVAIPVFREAKQNA